MRRDIEEIVQISERICSRLDDISQQDRIFNTEIGSILEKLSWDMLRLKNDIKTAGDLI